MHDTIVVANNGDSSILIFGRKARGDVAPVRTIRGSKTGIDRPIGIAVDPKNGEIWVSNWGDHSALAFDSGAYWRRRAETRDSQRSGRHSDARIRQPDGAGVRFETRRVAGAELSDAAAHCDVCQAGER